jgi:hypothetical protein
VLAEQTDEWTEQRRYMGIELRYRHAYRHHRTCPRGDRRVTSTQIFPVIVSYTITVGVAHSTVTAHSRVSRLSHHQPSSSAADSAPSGNVISRSLWLVIQPELMTL